MRAVGYAGIAFTETGRAAVLLENGEWLTMTAAQGNRLVRGRAEEGLPPIPIVEPPEVLPTRDPLRSRPSPRRHTKIELPSSVITQPLVLWQSAGGRALTCERVIAYPNGFEIELRASGLLIEDPEMPWGRSSRGFWHLRGLQLTVTFADGRSRRIEDLTSGDEESAVTISPFRRDDSDLESLWLWVMPSPADGHVRLVATWTLRGIDRAAVEFDLASSRSDEAAP